MHRGRFGGPVSKTDPDQDVSWWRLLGVFDKHVEVPVLVEHASIEQFILQACATTPSVRFDEVVVRIRRLWIFVEQLHVGMCGRRIEIEVILLHVLPVMSLTVRQPEHPLLEDWILAVQQSEGKAQVLLLVADAGDAVLAQVIGPRSGLVVSEIVPGVAVVAVVFPDSAPLPFAEIGPPKPPGRSLVSCLLETRSFGRLRWFRF